MENRKSEVPEQSEVGIYNAAAFQAVATAWVAQFVFSDVKRNLDGGSIEVPRVAISMPWPMAKVLHRVLGLMIEAYEKQEGEIAVPKSVAAHLETHPVTKQ